MVYHLYQRTIVSKGKKVRAWYYWYYDCTGKQIRKSLGTAGKPCLLKREAQSLIAELELKAKNPDANNILSEYCKGFFEADSDYILRKKAKGYEFQPKTLIHKQRCLECFLNEFGNVKIKDLKTKDIDRWLLRLNKSVGYKNKHISVINDILSSLYTDELINNQLQLETYKQSKVSHKGILYPDEIALLFPENYDDLIKVWKNPVASRNNTDYEVYQFATIIYLILTTGMRSGEIRALKQDQFIRNDAILINAMMDSEGKRSNHLKKGDDENKKWRIVILPSRTVKMLQNLQLMTDKKYTDFIFELNGLPVEQQYLNSHFQRQLDRMGIDHRARNLSIHSLRFTYNTLMKRAINNNDLRAMIGHVSEVMTDYYDRAKLIDNLPGLLENKAVIDSVFK